jgi:hypothetical protein
MKKPLGRGKKTALLAGAAGFLASLYLFLIRPWTRRWGAGREELRRVYPGDELISDPAYTATRAVTIEAPAAAVWARLVQMGPQRGSLRLPGWQSTGYGTEEAYSIAVLDPRRALVYRTSRNLDGRIREDTQQSEPADINLSWGFYLEPLGENRCRLVSRFRTDYPRRAGTFLNRYLVLEPQDFIRERELLLAIKHRAERDYKRLSE